MNIKTKTITLQPINNKRLVSLCGPFDDNLKELEHRLGVTINRRNNLFKLIGDTQSINIATNTLLSLYSETKSKNGIIHDIYPKKVYLTIKNMQVDNNQCQSFQFLEKNIVKISANNEMIKPRTLNQAKYIKNIFNYNIIFGIGPAGTGKTYLAVAAALNLLENQKNQHIILSRPAIEAGEKLGFLPGDLNQKTDPYIRPLYDILFNILGNAQVEQLIQKNMIEVIPLAYMRGRTLNNSIIILDESQNTTITQMKMFLTRIGFNSTIIITGDTTQIDLPSDQISGLTHAIKVLLNIKDISFNFFNATDIVRHPLVTRIVDAYTLWDQNKKFQKKY